MWLYVRFKLGNSTKRYIYDTQNLNIICIILYSAIFPFFEHYFHFIIYAISLVSLHRTYGPSHCLFFVICNAFVVHKTGKTAPIHGCCLIILHNPLTIRAKVASLWYTYTKVSALHWYSYYCGLVYSINIIFRTIQGECFYSPTIFKRFLWDFSVLTQYS